ncbi:MAG: hypothetical protein ABL867_10395 [Rickettsiales bacterium]
MSKKQYPNPSLYNPETHEYTIPQCSTTDMNDLKLRKSLENALVIAQEENVTVTFVHKGKDKKGTGAFKLRVSPNNEIEVIEPKPEGVGHKAEVKSPQPKKSL